MTKRFKITESESNWEVIAFLLIKKILGANRPCFSRRKLMSEIDMAISISEGLGHKEHPEHPEETLQRTIQNLRDKGYIEFLRRGEYKLTENGLKRMEEEYQNITRMGKKPNESV